MRVPTRLSKPAFPAASGISEGEALHGFLSCSSCLVLFRLWHIRHRVQASLLDNLCSNVGALNCFLLLAMELRACFTSHTECIMSRLAAELVVRLGRGTMMSV
eukprot:355500-Pelagomonas_calceolata.AAC.3